jgi:hypothetical protein
MKLTCDAARDLLLESRGVVVPGAPELREHLKSCPDCADHAVRAVRVSAALSALPRARVPHELDGLAVASLHEGFRQDRAVATLRSLGRLSMPRELSGRRLRSELHSGDPLLHADASDLFDAATRAPAVLDRLVDENLRRGSADAGRRFASRLDRLRAPRALRNRIESSARFLLDGSRAQKTRIAAAAAVLLLLGGGLWLGLRAEKDATSGADLQVRYESSLDAMDPMARSLLGGLSGGLVDAGRAKKL